MYKKGYDERFALFKREVQFFVFLFAYMKKKV